jgi:hypothetical protein
VPFAAVYEGFVLSIIFNHNTFYVVHPLKPDNYLFTIINHALPIQEPVGRRGHTSLTCGKTNPL